MTAHRFAITILAISAAVLLAALWWNAATKRLEAARSKFPRVRVSLRACHS
jgi:hypothetical protein